MDYVTRSDITQRAVEAFRHCPSLRLREILQAWVRHLHAFASETALTRDEWLFAIDFLCRAGQICSRGRNEFMGLSDALGLTALVELMSDDGCGTPINPLGPFYREDTPELPFNADLKGDHPGESTLLRGRVLDSHSRPLAGARIDIWHTRADGLYDVQVAGLEAPCFRGWMRTQADGSYQVRTIKPLGYTAPMDGPLGQLLTSTRRNEWRPAHWHFAIRAADHRTLVTELYPRSSPHLADDFAFGPREGLVVDLVEVHDASEAQRVGLPVPFQKLEFDFRLMPL